MWFHNLDPVLFKIGSLEIRYYGLVYLFGFFISFWWLSYLRKKKEIDLSKEELWDFTFWLLFGLLLGARLFMVFWEPSVFLFHPENLLKIWEGGMSFHGGLVGLLLAGYFYGKKKNLKLGKLADVLCLPLTLALALGRIANFINGELVGRITSVKWCVIFPSYEGCRHPSTLYAAGKRFLVFCWLGWLFFKKKTLHFKEGFLFWNFIFWEGLGRFLVDFYREDVLYFNLSLGQWFSLVMVLIAFFVLITLYKKEWQKLIKDKPFF